MGTTDTTTAVGLDVSKDTLDACLLTPDRTTRQRRLLITARQELVGRRVRCQNRLRGLFAGVGLTCRLGRGRGVRTGWRSSSGRPSRWPSAAPTRCGGG